MCLLQAIDEGSAQPAIREKVDPLWGHVAQANIIVCVIIRRKEFRKQSHGIEYQQNDTSDQSQLAALEPSPDQLAIAQSAQILSCVSFIPVIGRRNRRDLPGGHGERGYVGPYL